MKHSVVALALAAVLAFVAGCASTAPYAAAKNKPKAFALSVTVQGGLQPTPLQWAAIQEKFVDEFWSQGWVLVTDLNLADYIVRVNFTPDPADPENSGKTDVVGVLDNPRRLLASLTTLTPVTPVTRYPTSFGYAAPFQTSLWSSAFAGGYGSYYGWGSSFYDGYSYSSPTLNPVTPPAVTPKPPYRHHQPGQPDDCPPGRRSDNPNFARHLPGDFSRSRIQPSSDNTTPALVASDRPLRLGAWQTSAGNGSTRNGSGTISTGTDRTGSRSGWWQSRGDGTYARTDSGASSSSGSSSSSSVSTSDRGNWRGSWQSRNDGSSGSSYSRSDASSSRSNSDYSRSDHSWSRSSSSGSDSSSWRSSHSSGSDSGSSHSGGWSGSHSGSSGSSYSSGSSSSSSSSSGSSSGSSSSSSGSSAGATTSQTTQPN